MARKKWMGLLLGTLALVASVGASVDVVRPEVGAPLGSAQLTALMLSLVVKHGVSRVLLAVAALIGLPWVLAGVALAASALPGRRPIHR
jgi:uncharacterized membrane protein HdeD (DUF308 family)